MHGGVYYVEVVDAEHVAADVLEGATESEMSVEVWDAEKDKSINISHIVHTLLL